MKYFQGRLIEKAHKLRFPKAYVDDINRLVLQGQSTTDPEQAPFRLQLNFWVLSIAVASAKRLSPIEKMPGNSPHFVDTRGVNMPAELCELLSVISLNYIDADLDKLEHGEPAQIIDLANRLAFVGVPEVLKAVQDGTMQKTKLRKALDFAGETASQVG